MVQRILKLNSKVDIRTVYGDALRNTINQKRNRIESLTAVRRGVLRRGAVSGMNEPLACW